MIGFAADTINVMFGDNAGIVAKMKELNPHCVYVKCVRHSVALALSRACKHMPRKLEQLVKEVHNYSSQSNNVSANSLNSRILLRQNTISFSFTWLNFANPTTMACIKIYISKISI